MEVGSMFAKRAQAAMEFLMTYGWAILVVLIVVGALAYFGVLNPQNLIPEKCVFPTMLTCSDWKVTPGATGTIQLILVNGGGKDMTISNVSVTSTAITNTGGCYMGANATQATIFSIKSGETKTLIFVHNQVAGTGCTIDTTKAAAKTKYAIDVNYTYSDSTFSHNLDGELFAKSS